MTPARFNPARQRTLGVILVSDGKPGHFNLADGVCAAVARRRTLAVTRLDVTRPRWLPSRVLSAATNLGASDLLPERVGTRTRPHAACDLVVSAGADTLAANVALARWYRCANIFYGSLRRYRPTDFSLVLTSYGANAGRPNHAWALKPAAFDPDAFAPLPPLAGRAAVIGLLVGGDSGTIRYQRGDWDRLIALVSSGAAAVERQQWIVSNSRRTPDEVSDQITTVATADPARVRFIDVRVPGAPKLATVFATCDAIAVTSDSSSMVSEAIWARRPVVVLSPQSAHLPALEQDYRDQLASAGWTAQVALKDTSVESLMKAFASVRPLTGNPLDALADLLVERLPTLFDQHLQR